MKHILFAGAAALAVTTSPAHAANLIVGTGNESTLISANDFKGNLEGLGLPILRTLASLTLDGPATIKVELLGSESGADDRVTIGGLTFTQGPDVNAFGAPVLLGEVTFNNAADFSINFSSSLSGFTLLHGPGSPEFGYFLPRTADGVYATNVLYLGYDNQITQTDDDNHDDLVLRLTVTAVPEPAAWAMMIGGFGLIGTALRRRRSIQVSFA